MISPPKNVAKLRLYNLEVRDRVVEVVNIL